MIGLLTATHQTFFATQFWVATHRLGNTVLYVAVINIEKLGCPRFDQLCYEETLPCCMYY